MLTFILFGSGTTAYLNRKQMLLIERTAGKLLLSILSHMFHQEVNETPGPVEQSTMSPHISATVTHENTFPTWTHGVTMT